VAENGTGNGLFTGYYEPELKGSRSPGSGFSVPLYRRPADLVMVDLAQFPDALTSGTLSGPVQAGQLVPAPAAPDLQPVSRGVARIPVPQVQVDLKLFPDAEKTRRIVGRVQDGHLVPYYSRAEIMDGALSRKRLELLWVASPIDAFFLEVQGAGRVVLPDHRVVRVAYAGQNGLPYTAIGRVLADQGKIPLEQVTMQSIRAWMESHPDQANDVMNRNESYVFFREVDGARPEQGPPGAMGGLALTPGRSIAVDRGFLPLGAPVWVDTTDPVDGAKWQHLTVAQDLGGAIRGAVRADIFFGWGPDAEERAGRMRASGREYVLLPKG
jgi:membrane-bound lytic murein transglycosylase A